MYYALRYDESLAWTELDDAPRSDTVFARLQVDEEAPLHDVEELVVDVVVMPVILALHHAHPHDGVVDAHERLIPPLVADAGDEGVERDLLERRKENVEVRGVRERTGR